MKLAILHCKKATEVCTGASCFKAYNNKLKSFELNNKTNKTAQFKELSCFVCA